MVKYPCTSRAGGLAHDDAIGRCQPLQPGGHVGRVPQGQLFLAGAAADLAHDHQPGMDPEAHGHPHPVALLQERVERVHGAEDTKAGPYGTLGVVFVRQGIAKVDQEPIAEILGNVARQSAG